MPPPTYSLAPRAGNELALCVGVRVGRMAGAFFGRRRQDGGRPELLLLFAVLMIGVSFLMLKGRSAAGDPSVRLNRENLPKLLGSARGPARCPGFSGSAADS